MIDYKRTVEWVDRLQVCGADAIAIHARYDINMSIKHCHCIFFAALRQILRYD